MKQIVIIILCLCASIAHAQTGFTRNNSIPVYDNGQLLLPWAGGLNFPLFSKIDLNGDNIPDLFAFDRSNNRVLTFINNGTSGTNCWEYAPQYADMFPAIKGWAFLYDYNCDNKPDLFCENAWNNGISQYRNDSQTGNIIFTLVDTSVKYTNVGPTPVNILASGNLVPDFNDIDGDGDMDIVGQQFQCVGGFAYFKNMSMEHYGVCDSLDDYVLAQNVFGEFALRTGGFKNVIVGSWNVTCFLFSPINGNYFPYEVARRDDTYANIKTIDIDGDGDQDMLIGDSQTDNSLLVINGGSNTHAQMTSQDTLFPSYNVPVRIHSFATHAYIDGDNDGKRDLLVSPGEYENKNGVFFYHNDGTDSVPQFNFIKKNYLQDQMIDVGESATPVLFDSDGDGLPDIVIGNRNRTVTDSTYVTTLSLYRNTGTISSPAFTFVTNDFAGLQSYLLTGQIFPSFGDMDNDGDMDMILGNDDGRLIYFMNTAGPGVTPVFSAPSYYFMNIDVGQASTPQLIDLNRDGLLDLVIGGKNGLIKYFQNSGTQSVPFFSTPATNDTLGGVIVQSFNSPDGYSVPFVFSQGNDYRMLVSNMSGDINLYGNIDGNLNGSFALLDTVLKTIGGSRYGYNLSVSGGDLNGDSLLDMAIGMYGGGMQIYYQNNPSNSVNELIKDNLLFSVLPNPASQQLVIKSNYNIDGALCTVQDMLGRKIFSQYLRSGLAVIDVSLIPAGVYMVRVSVGAGVQSQKVIVTH